MLNYDLSMCEAFGNGGFAFGRVQKHCVSRFSETVYEISTVRHC